MDFGFAILFFFVAMLILPIAAVVIPACSIFWCIMLLRWLDTVAQTLTRLLCVGTLHHGVGRENRRAEPCMSRAFHIIGAVGGASGGISMALVFSSLGDVDFALGGASMLRLHASLLATVGMFLVIVYGVLYRLHDDRIETFVLWENRFVDPLDFVRATDPLDPAFDDEARALDRELRAVLFRADVAEHKAMQVRERAQPNDLTESEDAAIAALEGRVAVERDFFLRAFAAARAFNAVLRWYVYHGATYTVVLARESDLAAYGDHVVREPSMFVYHDANPDHMWTRFDEALHGMSPVKADAGVVCC